MKIKVCGITNIDEALALSKAGVNYIGFIFYPASKRYVLNKLTLDQINRLNALGFSWDPFAEQWERAFSALQKFHTREGHGRVPASHKEHGLSLGGWVSWQRSNKKRLTPDRLKRLNDLGFVWKA